MDGQILVVKTSVLFYVQVVSVELPNGKKEEMVFLTNGAAAPPPAKKPPPAASKLPSSAVNKPPPVAVGRSASGMNLDLSKGSLSQARSSASDLGMVFFQPLVHCGDFIVAHAAELKRKDSLEIISAQFIQLLQNSENARIPLRYI
jgi:hypothetical protein